MTTTLATTPPAEPATAVRTARGPAPRTAGAPARPGPASRPTVPQATSRPVTPRTPRPRTAPGGPAGSRPRGAAGVRPSVPHRTPPRALPPHTVFAERLLAVLSGERPVHWMLGYTVGEGYEQLVRLAPGTPLRSLGPRPVLRRCAMQLDADRTVIEAFASIATGSRVRAMAFRLERGTDHRWRCAAVELDDLRPAARAGAACRA
ncbi:MULTISPECIES: Rv3235 family protein [unclassified Streptomyces]|uniref:Rv3235 family protein n=1 Tax=unclassified Streptomyces TaxID=2593676 RepID=UPI0036C86531